MTPELVIADGIAYEVIWDGQHRNGDWDLFRKVDWRDPKSRIEIRAAVVEELTRKRAKDLKPRGLTARKYLQGWRNRRADQGAG